MKDIKILFILLIILLVSCKTNDVKDNSTVNINDLWLITAVDRVAVGQDDFSGDLPTIDFNITTSNFMGSTGCNRIRGDFQIVGSKISFKHSITTRMMCEKMEVSDRISQILSDSVYDFKIIKETLIFYKDDVEVIKFKNIKD